MGGSNFNQACTIQLKAIVSYLCFIAPNNHFDLVCFQVNTDYTLLFFFLDIRLDAFFDTVCFSAFIFRIIQEILKGLKNERFPSNHYCWFILSVL